MTLTPTDRAIIDALTAAVAARGAMSAATPTLLGAALDHAAEPSAIPSTTAKLRAVLNSLTDRDDIAPLYITRRRTSYLVYRTDGPATAHLVDITQTRDGAFIAHAVCDRCQSLVTHGLGDDPNAVDRMLGSRVAHCARGCRDYELVDPDDIVDRFLTAEETTK